MIRLTRAALLGATLLAAPLTLATLPQAAFAQGVTIPTARGEVSVAEHPKTVVAYDIPAIDTLTALGVPLAGVPDRLYVSYLDGIDAAPVGTLFEPDLEALAGVNPDLVIVGGRTAAQYDAVSALAPTIDMTIWEDTIGEARSRIKTYGDLFDKQDKAAEMTADFDAKLEAAKAAVAGKGNALIVLTNGPKVSAYGKGSRFGWIHSALGLPEAYEKLTPETHGDSVSFEFINEVNPDWLIVVDRAVAVGEAASAQATLDNPLVAQTTAGKTGQILYLSPTPLYIAGGGYTSVTQTLDEITKAFSQK